MKRHKPQPSKAPTAQTQHGRLLIAIIVDCGRADVSTRTLAALLQLTGTADRTWVQWRFFGPSAEDRTLSLNIALTGALDDPNVTHFLIVDADTVFDPSDIESLLREDEDFSALALPIENLDLASVHSAIAEPFLHSVQPKPIEAGFGAPAPRLILGKRKVLEQMVKTKSASRFVAPTSDEGSIGTAYFGFAAPLREEGSNRQLDHKAAFYHRWRHACGGHISIRSDMSIEVSGRYELKLKFDASRVA
ncbi:MAG: hypothetical protein K2P80_14680 [Beijerinckiaceae bacterium]|nr:hypothetical protein [Beijerinckiaceae bacterium]